MKKALLYLLLFSYSIIVLKPVMPTLADTVAHVFWYSEHMATVHYENGRYHVHLEYADAAKKGSPEKNNTLKEDEGAVHLNCTDNYSFGVFPFRQRVFYQFSSTLLDACVGDPYSPPRSA